MNDAQKQLRAEIPHEEQKDEPMETERKAEWSNDELQKLFQLVKKEGSKWTKLQKYFPGRTNTDVKNKFYCELKKVATQAKLEDPERYDDNFIFCKSNLMQFIDIACKQGHRLSSKKGRKTIEDRAEARKRKHIFTNPKESSPSKEVDKKIEENIVHPTTTLPQYYSFPAPLPHIMPIVAIPISQLNTKGYYMCRDFINFGK